MRIPGGFGRTAPCLLRYRAVRSAAHAVAASTVVVDTPWVISADEQIRAILSWNTWHWAVRQLGDGETMDNVRFRDLVSVTEDDVYDYVVVHGFNERAVVERGDAEDHLCIVPKANGRWTVYYTERGMRSDEIVLASLAEARREVVHRLMVSARIALNHNFKLAHPEMHLPLPSEMD